MSSTQRRIAATQTAGSRRFRRALAAAGALLISLASTLGLALPAQAHDVLVDTHITPGATAEAPATLTLTFNNSVIEVGTEILLTGADGSDITLEPATVKGTDVQQALPASLPAGNYQVAWRVVSSDGHPIEGTLWFTRTAANYELLSEKPAEFVPSGAANDKPQNQANNTAEQSTAGKTADGGPSPVLLVAVIGGGILVIALAAYAGVRLNRRGK